MADHVWLAAIHRFPVKGFGPQVLPHANLAVGYGLPFDRFLGIANGHTDVSSPGWSPCEGFVRLTKNRELPLYHLDFDSDRATVAIGTRNGETAQIDWRDPASIEAANAKLATWFSAGPLHAPRLVRRDAQLGWWDCNDAPLSIINLQTVRALAARAGREIDARQFRGNLLVDGLAAWRELAWLGLRLRVGQAELEVLRPIERCQASSVDVKTAEILLNVPALLAGVEGHLCCGVYARVVRAGRVHTGDPVIVLGPAPEALRDGAANPGAPESARWPRWATLVRKSVECPQVTSYWLRDPTAAVRGQVRPGQHLRVHV
ncbi:MAG TPA: MOSC domain-containing protein, partial [Rubrivivax sp.]|nr:MOSC domain-containing protein [Rubrivivax sp.]